MLSLNFPESQFSQLKNGSQAGCREGVELIEGLRHGQPAVNSSSSLISRMLSYENDSKLNTVQASAIRVCRGEFNLRSWASCSAGSGDTEANTTELSGLGVSTPRAWGGRGAVGGAHRALPRHGALRALRLGRGPLWSRLGPHIDDQCGHSPTAS